VAKYDRLEKHLKFSGRTALQMTFEEVEAVLRAPLPRSAYAYPAWWANEKNGPHVQAKAWMRPGFAAQVDMEARTVWFRRVT
jgi:hypothetical protein